MLKTEDFPQADILDQVGEVARAVAENNYSDSEIEEFIGLQSHGRQGRYYRKASEILGLISTTKNISVLTPLGKELVSIESAGARREFLVKCLLDTPLFKEALSYIRLRRPTDKQLKSWFFQVYKGAEGTASRRYKTFDNYMNIIKASKIIKHAGQKNILGKYTGLGFVKTMSIKEGVARSKTTGIKTEKSSLRRDIDLQKLERANDIHMTLVSAKGVSTKLCKLINLSKHRRWTNEGRETGKDGRSKS